MAQPTNAVRFNAAGYGTADFVVASAATGFVTPESANVTDGKTYRYYAQSADGTQWEAGSGPYTVATHTLSRTTIQGTSNGDTNPVNFALAPIVDVFASPSSFLDTPDVLYTPQTLTAAQQLQAVQNVSGVSYASQTLTATQQARARTNIVAQAQGDFAGMSNGTLVASAAAGALTVAVKTFAGADPSAADPVYFYFRNNTLTAGDFTRIAVTAALSVVLGSTTTVGATSGQGLRVWISAHNNAGTVQLGAINCSDSSGVYSPQEHVKYTTTLPANSSKLFYSTSAIVTAAPWRLLGFCEWNALATAGTWVAPDVVELFSPGAKKPGDVVQTVYATTSSVATNTTNTFVASNLTLPITPTSAANLVKVVAVGSIDSTTQNNAGACQIHRGSTAIGSTSFVYSAAGGEATATAANHALDLPNTTASTTYAVKFKNNGAGGGTIGYPGAGTAVMQAEEIMG